MKIFAAIALMAATAAPAFALGITPLTPSQAAGSQGSNVLVEGPAIVMPALGTKHGMEIHLGDGDNSGVLIAFIPEGNLHSFPDLNRLNGHIIGISGVVERGFGQARIRVTSPDQINLVR